MIFYGSKYALLQSCIVRYSVKLEFFMHVHGDHDGYSFDDSSAQSFTILVDMVPIVQDVRILAWWDYSDTVLQLSRKCYTSYCSFDMRCSAVDVGAFSSKSYTNYGNLYIFFFFNALCIYWGSL